jgi:hypothetical protein
VDENKLEGRVTKEKVVTNEKVSNKKGAWH